MAVVSKLTRKELTLVERAKLWALYCEGYTPTQIFNKTKVPRTTVSSFIQRETLTPTMTFQSKPRSGAPKKITPRGARALVQTVINELRMSLKSLATPSKSGKRLNHYTVAILLKSFGKAKRRPRKKPFLTPLHKQKRRFHCREEKAIKRDNRKVY